MKKDLKISGSLAQLAAEIGRNKVILQHLRLYSKLGQIEKLAREFINKPDKKLLSAMYDLIISYKTWGPNLPNAFPAIYRLMYEVGELYLENWG